MPLWHLLTQDPDQDSQSNDHFGVRDLGCDLGRCSHWTSDMRYYPSTCFDQGYSPSDNTLTESGALASQSARPLGMIVYYRRCTSVCTDERRAESFPDQLLQRAARLCLQGAPSFKPVRIGFRCIVTALVCSRQTP